MSTRTPDDDTAPRYVYVREPEAVYVVPRDAPPRNQIVLLLMLLLLVLLMAVATGRGLLLRFSGAAGGGGNEPVLSTRVPGPSINVVPESKFTPDGCRLFSETSRKICGRIRQFYEQNGDIAAFGQPISDERPIPVEGRTFQAQWFERGRIELHPENQPPYDVLLGRLGAEALANSGRVWQSLPAASASAPHFFDRTRQAIAAEFWNYWSGRGLNFSGSTGSFEESLALFGYPISGAQPEPGDDGKPYLTQWFERARFQYHPEASAPNQVRVELFGTKMMPTASQPTGPYPTPVP
jgi:hypothetical protein